MFKETYFYIESGYIWGKGHSENESNIFNAEIKRIFENVLTGWTLKEKTINNACNEYLYKDGLSSLYCHPMTISGIIDTDLIVKESDSRGINLYRALNKTEFKTWSKKNKQLLQEIGA